MVLKPNIRGLIFDLDNTLYENPVNKDAVFAQAAALAAIELGLTLTFQEALVLAEQSYHDHKSENAVFCKEYGLAEEKFHQYAHKNGADLMIEAVAPLDDLKSAFNRLAAQHDVMILTHGSQHWAESLMAHFGYAGALKPNRILGLDHPDVLYRRKNKPEIFEAMAKTMNLKPAEIAVIEDTAENLISPHALGMQTIFVHWGKPLTDKPDFINAQIPAFTAL